MRPTSIHLTSKIMMLWLIVALSLFPFFPKYSYAQEPAKSSPVYSEEEINQLVAPIALYPDALLTQILMASTYPLEIVSAARWVKSNPNLKDKALEDALQSQPWDPSVKSLAAVPSVLKVLNKNLEMTERLGNVFLAQPKDVMEAIQALRAKAETTGTIESNQQQTVRTTKEGNSSVIVIEPADPSVIYVPLYDPNLVYGDWPYTDYPPYDFYPTDFFGTEFFYFGTGMVVGNALWGHSNWRDGVVGIDVNQFNRFNHSRITDPIWHHNAEHRRGVPYEGTAAQERFGNNQQQRAEARGQAREQFRSLEQINAGHRETSSVTRQHAGVSKHHGVDQSVGGQNLARHLGSTGTAHARGHGGGAPSSHQGFRGGQGGGHVSRGAASVGHANIGHVGGGHVGGGRAGGGRAGGGRASGGHASGGHASAASPRHH